MAIKMSDNGKQRMRFNVCGHHFSAMRENLQRYPDTRLARLAQTANGNATSQEHFFDADEEVFKEVLRFYRTGKLYPPNSICQKSFVEQLQFWGIDECYIQQPETSGKLEAIEEEFRWFEKKIRPEQESGKLNWRWNVWDFLTDPMGPSTKYKSMSKAWTALYLVGSLAYLLSFSFITLPNKMLHVFGTTSMAEVLSNSVKEQCWVAYSFARKLPDTAEWRVAALCIVLFMTEVVVRFVICPKKKYFIRSIHMLDIWLATQDCVTLSLTLTLRYLSQEYENKALCYGLFLSMSASLIGSSIRMIKLLLLAAATIRSGVRSEEHTSELQSRPHISYAVFCLKKKKKKSMIDRKRKYD